MIVGRWHVQLAGMWHWYLLLCIFVMFDFKAYVSVYSLFRLKQILVSIN